MTSPEPLPSLLRLGETIDLLGTSRSQLQNLFPHLHILAFPRGTRRFPLPYIANLRNYLIEADEEPHLQPVRAFAVSNLARYAISNAETDLEAAVSDHIHDGHMSAADIARTLNFGRMSVSDWIAHDELTAVRDKAFRKNSQITEESLRALYHWEYPEDIRGRYPQAP